MSTSPSRRCHHHDDIFIELADSKTTKERATSKARWSRRSTSRGRKSRPSSGCARVGNLYVAQAFRRPIPQAAELRRPREEGDVDIGRRRSSRRGYFVWADADTPSKCGAQGGAEQVRHPPSVVVTTGTVPTSASRSSSRPTAGWSGPDRADQRRAVGGRRHRDHKVADCNRVMRLGGSISFPSGAKAARARSRR